ncbi:unnamed protein product [Chrysodeixis includens]|uniref:Uncharacterized protein n=1 Tax=Chrysodeixis includens TaxID=689277 RepID=A0A9N8KVE8_CHRIL|nr:unnamed protein product [Chrysodeixis includens]
MKTSVCLILSVACALAAAAPEGSGQRDRRSVGWEPALGLAYSRYSVAPALHSHAPLVYSSSALLHEPAVVSVKKIVSVPRVVSVRKYVSAPYISHSYARAYSSWW